MMFAVEYRRAGDKKVYRRLFRSLDQARSYGQGLMNGGGIDELRIVDELMKRTVTLWEDY